MLRLILSAWSLADAVPCPDTPDGILSDPSAQLAILKKNNSASENQSQLAEKVF